MPSKTKKPLKKKQAPTQAGSTGRQGSAGRSTSSRQKKHPGDRRETITSLTGADYRTLAENSLQGVAIFQHHRLVYANSANCKIFGYTLEEFLAMSTEQLVALTHPEDRTGAIERIRKRDQGEEFPFNDVIRILRKDGSSGWIQSFNTRIEYNGEPAILVTNIDLSEQKHAELEHNRRVSELEALYENGLLISQLFEPRQIAQKMVDILSNKLNWHHAAVRLYRPEDNRMELLALSQPGLSEEEVQENIKRLNEMLSRIDRGLSGWVIRNRQPVRSGNLPADSRYVASYPGMHSGLYVPLQTGNTVLGSIAVETEDRDAFSEQDERLLVTLANQATIAIRNAQLYLQTQKELEERRRAEQERRRLIHDLGERVKELTVLHNASRIFMDQSRNEDQVIEELTHILPSGWQYSDVTAARIVLGDRKFTTSNFRETPWMQSQLFTLPNNTQCVINVAYLEEKPAADEGPFLKEERYLLESIAEKLQTHLAGRLADQSIQRHNVEMSLLLEVGRELSNTMDLKDIYSIVYRYITNWVPCDHLMISSYDHADQLIHCEYLRDSDGEHDVSNFPAIPLEPEGQGTQSLVIHSGRSLLLPDYLAQLNNTSTAYSFNDKGEIVDHPERGERTRSAILVPFIMEGHVTGVMQVFHHTLNAHTEYHLHFVESLAFRVSGALANAKLFHQLQAELHERKLVEEKIRQLNSELEGRVKERTTEIEATRQRLELATTSSGIGVWELNFKNNDIFWDDRMYAIHGLEAEDVQLSEEYWWTLLHPEDLERAHDAYRQALDTHKPYSDEYRILLPDGSIRHISGNGVVLYDADGKPERMVGVNMDVTMQRRAEQALHESENYARLLFEAAPDPVYVSEVNGVIIDANRLFEQQHQVRISEARGKHISELNIFPPRELQKAQEYVSAIMSGKIVPPVELDFYGADETIHTLEMNSYPIEVRGKQLVLSTSRDITVHKKAEETLRLANAEMERALRIKDEFLASMSHELRTPLNAILGISESLEEQIIGPLNEKQLKYLRTINESGRHLHELINDILDLSKIEAGRMEMNILDLSVAHLCESSMRMIKELAQKKGLTFSSTVDPAVKTMKGDERRLKQVLVNLLSNAVKFTPDGKEIGLEVQGHPETSEIRFTVWDHGIGIDSADMDRLFKPFVQLDSSLSREYAGTGLGLALVAQMVRLHGGNVGVESELGRGSRFTITLPWKMEGSQEAPVVPGDIAAGAVTSGARSGSVLIVEDTHTVASLMKEYLENKGYVVYMAGNGMDGVMLAKSELPDIILMDVMMPVMDGMEAAREIRTERALDNVPIIALTALAMPGDRERCLAAGMNDYLSKPIQFKELLKVMDRHLTLVKSGGA